MSSDLSHHTVCQIIWFKPQHILDVGIVVSPSWALIHSTFGKRFDSGTTLGY